MADASQAPADPVAGSRAGGSAHGPAEARVGHLSCRPVGAALYFLPVGTRVPLKFGRETTTTVTCARVRLSVSDAAGRRAHGWGETPLSVQWVWPSTAPFVERHEALCAFAVRVAAAWAAFPCAGHPVAVGYAFLEEKLPALLEAFNRERAPAEPMPWLAALVCCSAFDLALHDAYGRLAGRPTYDTYNAAFMSHDLSHYLTPDGDIRDGGVLRLAPWSGVGSGAADVSFGGRYPADYLVAPRPASLPAWHLVGGVDPLTEDDLTGEEPADGYPVLLRDWIRRDGLKCLKVKLRGNDAAWDYDRVIKVGAVASEEGCDWLSADFNCTVTDPEYVNGVLDRLVRDAPRTFARLLYVEQPFPYDLQANRIDVRSVSARKPLFMDESAHDWRLVRLGRGLGWTGVALKTCKTQTGALLSLCWAKAQGMMLMVQDLTNPMLAQIPHVLLAAHAGTMMGVETNAMQFYPEASLAEAAVHPGLYARHGGRVDLSTLRGPGFGYREDEIRRRLPEPAACFED